MATTDHPVLSLPPAEVIDRTQRDMREVALDAAEPWPWGSRDVALAVAEFLGSAIPYARLRRWQDYPQVIDALQVCHEWWATRPVPAVS